MERSLKTLTKQREQLEEKRTRHAEDAAKELRAAAACKSQNNIPGAIACMRKHKKHSCHVLTISGIVNTLTDHMHSLESKMMSTDTMSVMKESVQALTSNSIDVGEVDDMMVHAEEQQQDIAHVTSAMSSMGPTDTDDELLALLGSLTVPATAAETTSATPGDVVAGTAGMFVSQVVHETASPDEQFEQALEAEIQMLLSMPVVPAHPLVSKLSAATPSFQTVRPPAYDNLARPVPVRPEKDEGAAPGPNHVQGNARDVLNM